MRSTVGVVLDEIPAAMRDTVAASSLHMPDTFWQDRATMQIEHTFYRLIYRTYFYGEPKGPLPLPPARLWSIQLAQAGAQRQTFQGHDAVLLPYKFSTTILTDAASPAQTEPRLSTVGDVWHEPFHLPLDPEFLLQRTGLACMNEAGYSPNTADSENARFLFDQDCDVETPETAVCHLTAPLSTGVLPAGAQAPRGPGGHADALRTPAVGCPPGAPGPHWDANPSRAPGPASHR